MIMMMIILPRHKYVAKLFTWILLPFANLWISPPLDENEYDVPYTNMRHASSANALATFFAGSPVQMGYTAYNKEGPSQG